jgi:hypothetical protein
MGLTIHYHLSCDTRSDKKVHRIVEELRKRALDLPFAEVGEVAELDGDRCDFQNYDGNDPLRWLAVQAGQHVERDGTYHRVQPNAVIAFTTWPGEGCEAANFGLGIYPKTLSLRDEVKRQTRKLETGLSGWCWSSFCKTEYASDPAAGGMENFLRCHLSVIRMLDHAKELGILASVNDEGDYWEKRDVAALAREVGEWNERMAGLVGKLKDMFGAGFDAPITQFPDFEHLEARGMNPKARATDLEG